MFHLYLLFAYLYVLWRFIAPLPLSLRARVIAAACVLVVSKYHLILLVMYGTMFSPEFPHWLVILAQWLFCSFALLFGLLFTCDLISLFLALLKVRLGRRLKDTSVRMVIAVVALSLSAVGVFQAIKVPDIKQIKMTVDGLPRSFDGLRIVQLSDLHISRAFQQEWVSAVVSKVNKVRPDVVFITGDLIDGDVESRRIDVEPLKNIEAPLGIIVIPGNHEYYFDCNRWLREFQKLNMKVLINSHLVLKRSGEEIVVAGVADEAASSFGMDDPDLRDALNGVDPDRSVILLKHRPQEAGESALAGVALQLSGHTHGGMVRGLDALVAYANQGYVSGHYKVGTMNLYVSNGTGLWNGFLMRLGVASEITEIILHSPKL